MKHGKIFYFISILIILLQFSITPVFAQSEYVLPYPSTMPGSFFYRLHGISEKILPYWYFGNLGRFFYSLKESDKYLVEAKVLFEYKQYLLAIHALDASNRYFDVLSSLLKNAEKEGKDVFEKNNTYNQAALKHKEVLVQLMAVTPEVFIWQDEKKQPLKLSIHKQLKEAISRRLKNL